MAGLERPTRIARIAIDGEDVSAIPASRRNCTTVFQHYALFPHMSVGQNVEYGLRVRGIDRDQRRQRAEDALALVRLLDKYGRRVHQLSGGERQRVALARALVKQPKLLLLDEPITGIAPTRVDAIGDLIRDANEQGTTICLIEHNVNLIMGLCDRIVALNFGRKMADGSPDEVAHDPDVVQAYLGG